MKTVAAGLIILFAIILVSPGCQTTQAANQYQMEMLEAYIDYNLGPDATIEDRQEVINAFRKSLNVPPKVFYTKR